MKEFKGKGEHSVNGLEAICIDYKEMLYQKQLKLQEVEAQRDKLLLAIQGAMIIVDLWKPPTSTEAIEECHIREFTALAMIKRRLTKPSK